MKEAYTKQWPLYSVRMREPKIDSRPTYQRGLVWSKSKKQLLMDSILRRYDIPKLYLRAVDKPPYKYEVVDGQQRLRAIWEFCQDGFPLSTECDPVHGHVVAGMLFSALPNDLVDDFQTYDLSFVILEDTTEDEVEEMFTRLNNGETLTAAEKRNAMHGNMKDFVRELASESSFFTKSVVIPEKRYAHDEVLAQITLVELNGGPCQVGYKQIKDMYEKNRSFKTESPKAKRIRYVLNFLVKAFPQKTPELNRVNTLSLYILSSELLGKYAISGSYKEFGQWFLDFEQRRHEDEAIDTDQRNPELVQYQLYLSQATASQGALNHRHRVLISDILEALPNLGLLDNQREFDYYQRIAIFRMHNGKCANPYANPSCQVTCEWDNFHADHILAWMAAGKTTVSNGQLLCPSCNQKKGAALP